MSFKYGVSYNCEIGNDCVGGADDGFYSLDMVGNDLTKITAYITEHESDSDLVLVLDDNGAFIGQGCSQGGDVVAYFGYDHYGDGEVYPTIVVFENPQDLTVIE